MQRKDGEFTMPSLLRRLACLVMPLIICLSLCACSKQSDDALERVIDSGEFVFGMADDNRPISWFDEDGTARGLAVDYGNLLASKLGATAVFREVHPENATDALSHDQIDCYLFLGDPGVKLSASIQSADTHIDCHQVIVVSSSSSITRLVDLSGTQVGIVSPSDAALSLISASELFSALAGTTEAEDIGDLLTKLDSGAVSAAAVDYVQFLSHTLADRSSYRIIDDQLGGGDYVLAFSREDEAMCARVEQLMSTALADGSLSAIAQQWLGVQIQ